MNMLSNEEVWNVLEGIPDPDIPVISITELGLVRQVETDSTTGKITVSLTPSYSGCPAMQLFQRDIVVALQEKGADQVDIKMVYAPAWTTDWITPEAREKMKSHGIAPPESMVAASQHGSFASGKPVTCPWCNGSDTKRTSQFGSTPCKALWFCHSCTQPFEYFKCF